MYIHRTFWYLQLVVGAGFERGYTSGPLSGYKSNMTDTMWRVRTCRVLCRLHSGRAHDNMLLLFGHFFHFFESGLDFEKVV